MEYTIPADKIYAVIELMIEEGKSYAAVAPSIWLHDTMLIENDDNYSKVGFCSWPKDEARLSDYVEKRRKLDKSDKWISHKVTILKLCKTITEAKNGVERALSNDALSSSTEADPSVSKRKPVPKLPFDPSQGTKGLPTKPKKKNQILSDSESGSDSDKSPYSIAKGDSSGREKRVHGLGRNEDDGDKKQEECEEENTGAVPSPKQDNGFLLDKPAENSNSSAEVIVDSQENIPSLLKSPIQTTQAGSIVTAASKKAAPAANATGSGEPVALGLPKTSTESHTPPRKSPLKARSFSPNKARSHWPYNRYPQSDTKNGQYRSPLLRSHYWRWIIKLTKSSFACAPILEMLPPQPKAKGVFPALPILDEEKEENFLEYIQDLHNSIIIHLSEFGSSVGRRPSSNGILSKLLSNKLASTYNFKGKNKAGVTTPKRSFEKSKLYLIFKAAMKRFAGKLPNPFPLDEKDLASDVMQWLKDAPKRYKDELQALGTGETSDAETDSRE